jgi:hypothetical protein
LTDPVETGARPHGRAPVHVVGLVIDRLSAAFCLWGGVLHDQPKWSRIGFTLPALRVPCPEMHRRRSGAPHRAPVGGHGRSP